MTPITLRNLCKLFGDVVAVDHVDLDIAGGDLFFLLGPSGCGKTTLLRMIGGFYEPAEGRITFGDRDVTHVPANKRQCGMVFQNYALWPHLNVRQNVGFGLDVRKVREPDKTQRVDRALQMVQMHGYGTRKPNELSGGQQQRVALARALVIEPTVLLLDEPLSNLDAKLRLEMRGQIRDICKRAGITALYVTHDQTEALSMADAIAVMNEGAIHQVGEPRQLYHRPVNRFVADFLGQTNFIAAQIVGRDGDRVFLQCPAGRLISSVFPDDLPGRGNVTCSLRPEAIRVGERGDNRDNCWRGRCESEVFLGESAQYRVRIDDAIDVKVMQMHPAAKSKLHEPLTLSFDAADVVVLYD